MGPSDSLVLFISAGEAEAALPLEAYVSTGPSVTVSATEAALEACVSTGARVGASDSLILFISSIYLPFGLKKLDISTNFHDLLFFVAILT